MLNKEKLRRDVEKAISMDPTDVIFYRSEESDFHEQKGEVEVYRTKGFSYTGNSMGGVRISITDEGSFKKNSPMKRLLVVYSDELSNMDNSYSVDIKGKRYKVLDPGETAEVIFDMYLEEI